MPFSKPDLVTIKNRIESDISSEISSPTTFLRRSVFKIIAKVLAGAIYLVYDFINYIKEQIFITTADGESLQIHGAEYGISKNFGTKAIGSGTASGTVGKIISAGSVIQSSIGNLYNITTSATIGAGGTTTITFQADKSGTAYNEDTNATLTFIQPLDGINTSVTVLTPGITGGVDEETNDAYRARILTRKRQPPHGGAEFDYVTWALEYSSSITRAWAISEYYGIGTIGLAFVKDNDNPIFPTDAEKAAVRSHIVQHTDEITGKNIGIPVTANPGFIMIDASAETINFTIQIYPNTSAIQTAVRTKLSDLILDQGGPGKTIYFSKIGEAISLATGEDRHKILFPTDDVTTATNKIHVLGDISFSAYNG